MNNLIFRHKMHFNLRLRCKKCALLLPCVSVVGSSGFSFLWRKQELGLWLQKMLVFLGLVIFFPPFGYVFNQLSNNLLKFCPLPSGGFLILSFPVPLPFLSPCLPVDVSHLLSPSAQIWQQKGKGPWKIWFCSFLSLHHSLESVFSLCYLYFEPQPAAFQRQAGPGCVLFTQNLRWWIRAPPPSPCPLHECLRCCLEEKWW